MKFIDIPGIEQEHDQLEVGGRSEEEMVDYFLTKAEDRKKMGLRPTMEDLNILYGDDVNPYDEARVARAAMIKNGRMYKDFLFDVLGYSPAQIATTIETISDQTKAYVGTLEPGIFRRLPNSIERIFVPSVDGWKECPVGRLTSGGKSDGYWLEYLTSVSRRSLRGEALWNTLSPILLGSQFLVEAEAHERTYILLSPGALGLVQKKSHVNVSDNPGSARDWLTLDMVIERGLAAGLTLCPDEIGFEIFERDIIEFGGIIVTHPFIIDGVARLMNMATERVEDVSSISPLPPFSLKETITPYEYLLFALPTDGAELKIEMKKD